MQNSVVSHHLHQLQQLLSKDKLSLMDIQIMKMQSQALDVLRNDHPEVQEILIAVENRIAKRMAS